MRILFMGTPEFAAVSLAHLLAANLEVVGVVTQPDRPKGRGLELKPSEVKLLALQHQLPLWQPQRVATEEFLEIFRAIAQDLVVVVAFGQKIPAPILFEPQYGCINVHGSILPEYRGAAPIHHAILNGYAETGVTTMYMDEGWDTGDIIYQATTPLGPDENFAEVYTRLAKLGGELLVKTVLAVQAGTAPRIPQNNTQATLAPKLKPELQLIDWNSSAVAIHNLVRVFAPSPGAETKFNQERLKIIETRLATETTAEKSLNPGQILQIVKNQGLLVATGAGAILITKVQPVGKKVMSACDFANGRRLTVGMALGD